MAEPVILDTARRHGVSDAEIKHALDNAWTVVPDQGEWDLDMYLGPSASGDPLEVGVAYGDEGHLIVVHAMPMRPMYDRYLDDFRK